MELQTYFYHLYYKGEKIKKQLKMRLFPQTTSQVTACRHLARCTWKFSRHST